MGIRNSAIKDSIAMREPTERQNYLSHEVIGAAIEVHRGLGPGYIEAPYEEALSIEMNLRGIPFERQFPVDICYKGHKVGVHRLDFLIDGQLVVETKAVEKLLPVHDAQVFSYLKAANNSLGLLLSFNVPIMKDGLKRIAFTDKFSREVMDF